MSLVYGCLPDPQRLRDEDLELCAYAAAPAPTTTVYQQPWRFTHQGPYPTCVGHATAACVEALLGEDVDPLELWRDARRRFDHRALSGTHPVGAVASLVYRGVLPDRHGKPEDYVSWDSVDLDAELAADDRRLADWARYRIRANTGNGAERIEQITSALHAGDAVLFASLVGPEFGAYRGGILTSLGLAGGHAQRVCGAGWSDEIGAHVGCERMQRELAELPRQRVFVLHNSYGREHGYGGLVVVSESVIASPYVTDVHVIRRGGWSNEA